MSCYKTRLNFTRKLILLLLLSYSSLLFAVPAITGTSTFRAQPGDVITITGSGFSTNPVQNIVLFGPNRAPVLAATSTSLTVQVTKLLGFNQVTVTVDGEISNFRFFIIYTSYKNTFINPHIVCTISQSSCSCNPGKHYTTIHCYSDGWLAALFNGLSGNVYADRGELFQRNIDYTLPGRPGAHSELHYSFTRHYRAKITDNTALGHNWNHHYFEHLTVQIDNSIIHNNGLERNDRYRINNLGNFVAPTEFYTQLTKLPDNSFVLRYPDGLVKSFDVNGKLIQYQDRNDNVMTFHYNAQNQLNRVNDSLGRDIFYSYNGAGQLSQIQDYIGRTVVFTHDGNGDLTEVRSPTVNGTANSNDFSAGKITRYTYSSGFNDNRLNHNLLTVTRPNEVASGGAPVLVNVYGANPNSINFDRITSQSYGDTTGTTAGGGFTLSYQALNAGVQSLDPNLPVARTTETDRNGNVEIFEYNRLGYPVLRQELTKGLRTGEPASFDTRMVYNADGRLLKITLPEGNTIDYSYDSGNAVRFAQGNRLSMTRTPDASRGGDQATQVTLMSYEPIYQQLATQTDPRGTDTSFSPAIAEPAGRSQLQRFSSQNFFDYQEAAQGVILPLLATELNITQADVQARLVDAGVNLGLGDTNADSSTPVRIAGNTIRADQPSVVLLNSSHQSGIEGDQLQDIVTLLRYNNFGEILSRVDPEGNVDTFAYYPENDPDGDGNTAPGTRAGLNNADGGYLKEQINDTQAAAVRNNATNPAPANISTKFEFDPVGNIIKEIDGRGITRTFSVNELNQIVRTISATSVPSVSSTEPLALTEFAYIQDSFFDHNDNIIKSSVEDRGDTSNTGGFVDTEFTYDILDNRLKMSEEVDSIETLITRYRYDANQNLTLTVQPEGNASHVIYDERDLRFASTRGAQSASSETLNPPSGSYNPRGGDASTTSFHYDKNRNLVESVDANDTDNSAGNNSTIAGVGDVTRFRFDGYDRQTVITDAVGNVTTFNFDPVDNIIHSTSLGSIGGASPTNNSGTGNVLLSDTEFQFDELNRSFQEDRLLFVSPGIVTQRPPNINEGLHTPGDNRVTIRTEYDRNSRQTFIIQDDLDTFRTDYDGVDRTLKTSDPESNVVEYAYDDNNNLIETRETDVSQGSGANEIFLTTYFYDSLNRVQKQVDNLGQTLFNRYDSRNNRVAMADAQGDVIAESITRRGFLSGGSFATIPINEFGNVTVYEYDGINRNIREDRVLTTTSDGDNVNIGADIFGVKTVTPTPDPNQSTDGLITVRQDWDKNSLLAKLTDDNGNQTLFEFDNLNRRISETKGVTVPLGLGGANRHDTPTTIEFFHDKDDNIITLIDENGSITDCNFDAINRSIGCTIQRAGIEVNRKDVNADFPPVLGTTATAFEYDGLSRMTRGTDDNNPGIVTDDSLITMAYDSLSRVIEESQKIGGLNAKVISSAWLAENLRVGIIYPDNRELVLTFDGLDRLDTVKDVGAANYIADYTYIGTFRIIERAFPINDTAMSKSYDGLRRVTSLEHRRGSDNSLIVGFGHDYDRMNNKLFEEKLHNPGNATPGNSELYDYDSVYRLDNFERGTLNAGKDSIVVATLTMDTNTGEGAIQNQDWMLDGLGNWDMQEITRKGILAPETRLDTNFNEYYVIDPNKADPPPPIGRDHSDNGNLISDSTLGYRWDYHNRLVEVCRLDPNDIDGADDEFGTEDDCATAGAEPIAQYIYDIRNRRIRKSVENSAALNGVTDFYYDDWRVLEERGVPSASDVAVRQFVYGVYIDEPLVMDNVMAGALEPTRFFYHQNTLSSTFALTTVASGSTNDGDLVEGYQYDAYGEQTVIDPGVNGVIDGGGDDVIGIDVVSAINNPYVFTGRRFDAETGIYYYRNRYFDSEVGRFISRDPLGYVDGMGLYEYVSAMTPQFTDPTGLLCTGKCNITTTSTSNLPCEKISGQIAANLCDKTENIAWNQADKECKSGGNNCSCCPISSTRDPDIQKLSLGSIEVCFYSCTVTVNGNCNAKQVKVGNKKLPVKLPVKPITPPKPIRPVFPIELPSRVRIGDGHIFSISVGK